MTVARSIALMILVAGLLASPTDLSSCGPFLTTALFTFVRQPEQPKDRFARGQLGILQSSYPRFYLYIAYRYLTGTPLSTDEQSALFPPEQTGPPERWSTDWKTTVPRIVDQWLDARKKVAGAGEPPRIAVERTITTSTEYVQYTNCLDDTFHTAIATLAARVSKFGAASPAVKEWLAGQDMVFANCSGEPPASIPSPPAADPLLRADRAYQIAAAHMYAGNFDEAESRFRQIAADKSSPWRDTSAYAVARVLIRKATVKNDAAAMAKAETQLQSVIADSGLVSVHAAARNLLDFVRARLHPEQRFGELAQVLVKPDTAIERDLTDYRFLYDKFEEGKFGDAKTLVKNDDLSDWLWTFHYNTPGHAIRTWHAKQSLPWLIATLEYLPKNDAAVGEAIRAADKLKADSPAFATAAFHVNRLLIDAHQDKSARDRLDAILANRAQYPLSAVNLFLAERMKVAANWNEFLQYAQRVPAGMSWDEDSDGPVDTDQNSLLKGFAKGRTTVDADGARVLNEQVPLKLLAGAATNTLVSPELRADIAIGAWTRAILLDDQKVASDLAAVVQTGQLAFKEAFASYISEPDLGKKKFAAAYLMLKHPGMHPYVDAGFGRLTAIDKIDDFRDNWWCSFSADEKDAPTNYYRLQSAIELPLKLVYATDQPSASFLSSADRSQGSNEWKKLGALPAAPSFLASQTVAYAQAHADDPRVPEALYLAVRSTRYGCTDAKTGALSKQAYDLLHQRYPDTDWARQTKYWYK